jgi:hypothetical protein
LCLSPGAIVGDRPNEASRRCISRPGPSGRADRVAYLGFVEFSQGGVLLTGDEVRIGSTLVGTIAGYDETHMPNHLNIVLTGSPWSSGVERGIALGQAVSFTPVFA